MRMKRNTLKELGLSNKEIEMVERDTYYKSEYRTDYRDEWYYGNDRVDELCMSGQDINGKYKFLVQCWLDEYSEV